MEGASGNGTATRLENGVPHKGRVRFLLLPPWGDESAYVGVRPSTMSLGALASSLLERPSCIGARCQFAKLVAVKV